MNKWKLIKSQEIFNSKWLSLLNNSYEVNGEVRNDYYQINRPDYVLIIAIDQTNNIIVERQYRRGTDEILYELPAGWIDDGETPVEAAKRELLEETGYQGEGELLGVLSAQPAFISMKAHVVLVRLECEIKPTNLSKDEYIEVFKFNTDKIKDMITNREITDMGFVSAMGLLFIKHSKIS
jgi:ADP-ribose pyrophosphatase